MRKLDNLYFNTRTKLRYGIQRFFNDEAGVSNIVAAVVMILVAVGLAAVLYPKISELVTNSVPETLDVTKGS